MKKIDKNDEYVRRAIWEIYKYKCFYTGAPLDYRDLELDHIIPESYKGQKEDLDRIIKKCGLEENFEIYSLYNLVPTNKYENRRKSDRELNINAYIYYLGLVKNNVLAIEERIEKLKKEKGFDKSLSKIKKHVDEETDKEKRKKIIEKIINFVSSEDEDFKEIEKTYIEDNELIYEKYVKRIGLKAIMPRYDNPSTKCVIYFKTLKVRDCMIILDNKTILAELFSGLFTNPEYGIREFIKYEKCSEKDNSEKNLDNIIIRIGNNKVRLSHEDIFEFCNVIDSFGKLYIESINSIENILRTKRFPLSKRENNYKLITLTGEEWNKLVKFANKHDVDNGQSKWYIFDKNAFYIKVYTNKRHKKYKIGYHAFFHSEYDEDIVLYPEFAPKYKTITWEFTEDINNIGIEHINEKENWDAECAYNWLIKEFVPVVFGKNYKLVTLKKENDIDDILRNSKVDFINYLKDINLETIYDLIEIITQLQLHYHSRPHIKYRVSKKDFVGIYSSILLCINRTKKIDLYYICQKLSLDKCKTNKELKEAIQIETDNANEKTVTGFSIDCLFRVLLVVLEDNKINLSNEDFIIIKKNIDYFIETHDREVLLNKYIMNFV